MPVIPDPGSISSFDKINTPLEKGFIKTIDDKIPSKIYSVENGTIETGDGYYIIINKEYTGLKDQYIYNFSIKYYVRALTGESAGGSNIVLGTPLVFSIYDGPKKELAKSLIYTLNSTYVTFSLDIDVKNPYKVQNENLYVILSYTGNDILVNEKVKILLEVDKIKIKNKKSQ